MELFNFCILYFVSFGVRLQSSLATYDFLLDLGFYSELWLDVLGWRRLKGSNLDQVHVSAIEDN